MCLQGKRSVKKYRTCISLWQMWPVQILSAWIFSSRHLDSRKLWKGHPASSSTDAHRDLKNNFLPTIMWLQTSQKVGFLKMCSWKMWALLFSGSCWALVGEDAWLSELGSCPVLVLTSGIKSTCSFTSLLVLWKKLSALLLRKLLVLKESDRFSFCSCNK